MDLPDIQNSQDGRGNEYLELRAPTAEHWLRGGEAYGDVESGVIQREMIRRTIHEHLKKEKRLHGEGIKVLTLFFFIKWRVILSQKRKAQRFSTISALPNGPKSNVGGRTFRH